MLNAVHSVTYNVVYYKLLLKIDQKSDMHEIKVFQHGLLNFQLMIFYLIKHSTTKKNRVKTNLSIGKLKFNLKFCSFLDNSIIKHW